MLGFNRINWVIGRARDLKFIGVIEDANSECNIKTTSCVTIYINKYTKKYENRITALFHRLYGVIKYAQYEYCQ